MAINYTSLLGLAQPVTGTEEGTWGTIVNTEITALVEEAVAGSELIDVSSSDVTLTTTQGAANQARNAILVITGSPGVSRNIIAPSQSKTYIVINGSDAAVVIKGSATTGVTVNSGKNALVVWNGSDFAQITEDPRVVAASGTSGTFTINSDTTDVFTALGLTGNVTFDVPSGNPTNGQKLLIRIKDNGTSRTLTWTTTSGGFRVIGATLPPVTVQNKVTYVGCIYNSTDVFWDVVAVTTQA